MGHIFRLCGMTAQNQNRSGHIDLALFVYRPKIQPKASEEDLLRKQGRENSEGA